MDPVTSSISSFAQTGMQSSLRAQAGARGLETAAADAAMALRQTLKESVQGGSGPDGISALANSNQVARADGVGSALKDFVHAVDAKGKEAESMRTALMTGQSNNIHQTMIALQESSVAFSLMVEVRNKVMETYQELMRMQV